MSMHRTVQPFAAIRRLAFDSLSTTLRGGVRSCSAMRPSASAGPHMPGLDPNCHGNADEALRIASGCIPRAHGREAVDVRPVGGRGDPNLVRQLRPGRPPRLAMACQVLAFIEACSRAHVAPGPPGAMRPGILHRTERRQTDVNRNGTERGRTRARPAVTSSAGPHGAGAEHDLRAGGRRELSPTDPARRARRRLDRVRSGCVDPRTDRREPWQRGVI